MILKTTSELVRIITTSTANTDVQCNFADHTSSDFTPDSQNTKISTAATTTVIGAPAASTKRQVKSIMIHNVHATLAQTVTIEIFDGTNSFAVYNCTLSASEHSFFDGVNWIRYNASGTELLATAEANEITGESRSLFKVGTAPENAGNFYGFWKDSGFPGAWVPGTPGLNGRNTDGTTSTDSGCINAGNPAQGSWYLRDFNITGSVTGQFILADFLWVNSGLVVTTTTAQTITQPTLPARDNNGATLGEGVQAGIIVTTATTNAGVITNMTLSYTNSDGTAGRVATIASFPATAVIGTLVKFQLQSGDKGVRSIQSITLGTTLTAGAISLICFEELASSSVTIANTGSVAFPKKLDLKLYNGHCILPFWLASSTTAVTLNGNIYFINK
jgi:hypothetical protein